MFERSAKGMVCTPLGLVMCRHARVLLGNVDRAQADVDAALHGNIGSLHIGCFSFFSGWPLADAVRIFREAHPRITVTIQVGTHEKLIDDLDSGTMDVLISRFTNTLNPLVYRKLTLSRDDVALTCAPGHPLTRCRELHMADCAQYPWVTALPGSRIRSEVEIQMRQAGAVMPGIIGALSLEFGLEMIADRFHLLTLSGSVAKVLAARGRLHVLPLDVQIANSPLAAIWRRDRPSTRQVRAFAAAFAAVIKRQGDSTD